MEGGLDLGAISQRWLNQCGPCDYGMPKYGCTSLYLPVCQWISSQSMAGRPKRAGSKELFNGNQH